MINDILDSINTEPAAGEQVADQDPEAKKDAKAKSQKVGYLSIALACTVNQIQLLSSMPLIVSDKSSKNIYLMECCHGELDVSGDIGAVGRLSSDSQKLTLDMKGLLFQGGVYDIPSVLVVNMTGTEAKVEAVVDKFWDLRYVGDSMDTETILEGSMDSAAYYEDASNDDEDYLQDTKAGDEAEGLEFKTSEQMATKGRAIVKTGKKKSKSSKSKSKKDSSKR